MIAVNNISSSRPCGEKDPPCITEGMYTRCMSYGTMDCRTHYMLLTAFVVLSLVCTATFVCAVAFLRGIFKVSKLTYL